MKKKSPCEAFCIQNCLASFCCFPQPGQWYSREGKWEGLLEPPQVGLSWYVVSAVGIKCPWKQLFNRKLVYARHSMDRISTFWGRKVYEMKKQSSVYLFALFHGDKGIPYTSVTMSCRGMHEQWPHLTVGGDIAERVKGSGLDASKRISEDLCSEVDSQQGSYRDPCVNISWGQGFSRAYQVASSWPAQDARLPAPKGGSSPSLPTSGRAAYGHVVLRDRACGFSQPVGKINVDEKEKVLK